MRFRRTTSHYPVFLLLLLITNCSMSSEAEARKDFYIRQALDRYFETPQDAKSLSLSGSGDFNCDSANCIFLNPATLGLLPVINAAFTVGTDRLGGEDRNRGERIEQLENGGNFAGSIPLGKTDSVPTYGTLALAYSRYEGDTDDTINSEPDGHLRSFGYGLALNEDLAIGYSFVFFDDQLRSDLADLHSHARFLHTFAARYQISPDFVLGAIFKLGIGQSDTEDFAFESNGLSHLKQYTGSLSAAKTWSVGTASSFRTYLGFDYSDYSSQGNLTMVSSPVTVGSDEGGYTYDSKIGLESEIFRGFSARAGFRYQSGFYEFKRRDLGGLTGHLHGPAWTAGAGYAFSNPFASKDYLVHLDYGFEYFDTAHGNSAHILSLSIPLYL